MTLNEQFEMENLRRCLTAARESLLRIAEAEVNKERHGDMAYAYAFGASIGQAKCGLILSEEHPKPFEASATKP